MSQLIIVGGCKGGVGKSMVAMAALDYLRSIDADILLVEADRRNQDVALAYASFERSVVEADAETLSTGERHSRIAAMKPMDIEVIDLADRNDWISFGRLIEKHKHRRIVVNTAVGLTDQISSYGGAINAVIEECGIDAVSLWPVNRQRFSLNALLTYASVVTSGRVHVLRNLLFGRPEHFVLLDNARKVRQRVDQRGGRIVDFPDLADLMADKLYCERVSIEAAVKDTGQPTTDRLEFARWQGITRDLMGRLL